MNCITTTSDIMVDESSDIEKEMVDYIAFMQVFNFASEAHDGQYRKNGVTPYIVHPLRCAKFANYVFGDEFKEVGFLLMLHDVVEDCDDYYKKEVFNVLKSLEPYFGVSIVEDMIFALKCITKAEKVEGVSRQMRLENYMNEVIKSPLAVCAKLIDRIDNLLDLNGVSDGFVKNVYLGESYYILDKIKSAGFQDVPNIQYLIETLECVCNDVKTKYAIIDQP